MVLTSGSHARGREADINPAATWTWLHRECVSIDCNSDLPSLKARKQLYQKPARIFYLSLRRKPNECWGHEPGFVAVTGWRCTNRHITAISSMPHSLYSVCFTVTFSATAGARAYHPKHFEGLWHWFSGDFHLGSQGVCIGVFTLDSTLTAVFPLPKILLWFRAVALNLGVTTPLGGVNDLFTGVT